MIMIVMHHFAVHGGFEFGGSGISWNRIWVQILSGGGRLGVDVFILISGYFLINSEYKTKKVITLALQIMEYALLYTLLAVCTGEIDVISIKDGIVLIVKAVLSIPYGEYWFATAYFILYMFSPYLNRLIKSLNKEMHFKLIITSIVIWCLFPRLLGASFDFNYVVWFVTLYFIAAYLRLYPVNFKNMKKIYWLVAGGSYTLLLSLIVVFDILSIRNPVFTYYVSSVREMNSPLTLVCAVFTFLAFGTLTIQSKIINNIASTTFGIYLLHDNPKIRNLLWGKIFSVNTYIRSPFFILYSLFVIGIIFSVCSIIEMLRMKASERLRRKWK